MKRLRIIFSTTLGWNPGDEFILFGIRNLLSFFGIKFDEIIYNRHPMIRTKFDAINRLLALGAYLFADSPDMQLKRLLSGRYEFMDNSFKKTSQKIADYIIIAGTPEWAGPRNEELLSWAVDNKVHGALVGVGLKNKLTKNARRFLSEFAELITTRDNAAYEQLKAFGAIKGVCPALFAAPETKKVERVENIAIVFQGKRLWANSVPLGVFDALLPVYAKLIHDFDAKIVCHHFADFKEAVAVFGNGAEVIYTTNSSELLHLYKDFDLVVGTRLHGVGAAASWGIPGILIRHDQRTSESSSFNEIVVSPTDDIIKIIEEYDWQKRSEQLAKHKADWLKRMRELLLRTSLSAFVENR